MPQEMQQLQRNLPAQNRGGIFARAVLNRLYKLATLVYPESSEQEDPPSTCYSRCDSCKRNVGNSGGH